LQFPNETPVIRQSMCGFSLMAVLLLARQLSG